MVRVAVDGSIVTIQFHIVLRTAKQGVGISPRPCAVGKVQYDSPEIFYVMRSGGNMPVLVFIQLGCDPIHHAQHALLL